MQDDSAYITNNKGNWINGNRLAAESESDDDSESVESRDYKKIIMSV